MKLTKKIRDVSKLIKEVEEEIETLQNYFIMNNKKYYVKKGHLFESNESSVSVGQIDRKGRIIIFEGKTKKKTFVLNQTKKNNTDNNNIVNNTDNDTKNDNTSISKNINNSENIINDEENEMLLSNPNVDNNINNSTIDLNKLNNKNNLSKITEPDSPDFYDMNVLENSINETSISNNILEKNNIQNTVINKPNNIINKNIRLRNFNNPPNESIKDYNN
jgi:hypothetical protein